MSTKAKNLEKKVAKMVGKKSQKQKASATYKSKAFKKAIEKAIVAEKKRAPGYVDNMGTALTNMLTVQADCLGDVAFVGGVAEGSGATQHRNKKYLLKSSHVRGALYGQTNAAGYQRVALVWILDNDPTGSLPTVATIFNTATPNNPSVFSELNPSSSSRFRIIARRDFDIMQRPAAAGQNSGAIMIDEYVDLKLTEVTTKGSDATIGSCQKNALYFVVLGSSSDDGSVAATLDYNHRLRFLDA